MTETEDIKTELNNRLHERTQAFLANEVKLLNQIRGLEQKLAMLQSPTNPRQQLSSQTILQKRFYDPYAHELSDWADLSPATVKMYFGTDPEKWPEICEGKMAHDHNEEYRIVAKNQVIIWP